MYWTLSAFGPANQAPLLKCVVYQLAAWLNIDKVCLCKNVLLIVLILYVSAHLCNTNAAEGRLRSVYVDQGSMTLLWFSFRTGGCVTDPWDDTKSSAVLYLPSVGRLWGISCGFMRALKFKYWMAYNATFMKVTSWYLMQFLGLALL